MGWVQERTTQALNDEVLGIVRVTICIPLGYAGWERWACAQEQAAAQTLLTAHRHACIGRGVIANAGSRSAVPKVISPLCKQLQCTEPCMLEHSLCCCRSLHL